MAEDYEVRAKLELDRAGKAKSALRDLGSRLSSLHTTLGRANSGASSLQRNLLAVGGTYLGVRALSNSFRSLSRTTVQVNSSVEDMNVSLATLMASAEGISFERATRSAGGLFRRLNDIAVQSPATASQLMDIFRGVYGPMRNAGTAMDDLLRFTQNTASVGAALQVDYAQLSRDISMMATGVAGTDVKTFRLLRSMRLITETTEEWNRMAQQDSARAATRLLEVFEQLGGPAASAFGRTWTGVSSTFRGLVEQFMRVFSGPTFAVIRDALRDVNQFLLRYRDNIERVLANVGTRVAGVFAGIVGRTQSAFAVLASSFDEIGIRIDAAIRQFNELRPILAQIARVMLIAKVVTLVLTPLFGLLAAFGSMIGGLSSLAGVLGLGAGAGGAAAAGAAGAGAAGGAAAAGGAGAALAALSAAVWPVVATLGIVVGVITAVWGAFQRFGAIIALAWTSVFNLSDVFGNLGTDIMGLLGDLWAFVEPILSGLGAIIMTTVIAALRILGGALTTVIGVLRILGRALRWIGENILPPLINAIVTFVSSFVRVIAWIGDILIAFGNWIRSFIGAEDGEEVAQTSEERDQSNTFRDLLAEMRRIWSTEGAPTATETPDGGQAPTTRAQTNIDMRGSRINIRQEFREADPDRVWITTRDQIEADVTSRTQSGFTPAFSR
jgi:hypothetical protein